MKFSLIVLSVSMLCLAGCDNKKEEQKKAEEIVEKAYGGNGCTKIRTPDEIKRGVPCK